MLDNLLSNAIKFTSAGGMISIRVERVRSGALGVRSKEAGVRSETSEISSSPLTPDPSLTFLKIDVTDTGIGIREEDQDKLFQPFQQLDGGLNRKYEGTGLGLSLCRKIIQMHDGDIWLEQSEPGKGSTFSFIIPAGVKDA